MNNYKETGYYDFGGCCNSGYFLGSSRTYIFLANALTGASIRPVPYNKYEDMDVRCLSTHTYAYGIPGIKSNTLSPKEDRLKKDEYEYTSRIKNVVGSIVSQDVLEITYQNMIMSEYISHYWGTLNGQNNLIAWRDDGKVNGSSPFMLGFWFNCNQACFPCQRIGGVKCGFPEQEMNELGDAMDNYWNANLSYLPWDGFLLDWYGILERRAEPVSGWLAGYINCGGPVCCPCGEFDEYCGCCVFCFVKDCIEPHFIVKWYGGSILALNLRRGIPFTSRDKILNYYDQLSSDKKYGMSDIKFDHLADETVFFAGSASWSSGDIYFREVIRPGSGFSSIYDRNADATIVSGKGDFTGFLSLTGDLRGGLRPAGATWPTGGVVAIFDYHVQVNRTGGQGFLIKDQAVKYKTDIYNTGDAQYKPWIYVDIPEPIQLEKSWAVFSFEANTLPELVYGGGVGFTTSSPSWSYQAQRKMFVRASSIGGGIRPYNFVTNAQEGEDDQTLLYYYKRYVVKSVKAPYHLYVKAGEQSFRQCLLGETLKNLNPGRYYFPNPAFANQQLGTFDPDFEYLDKLDLVYKDTGREKFSDYFNTYYRLFLLPVNKKFDSATKLLEEMNNNRRNLQVQYNNAITLLGLPSESNGMVMEYGGGFKYYTDTFDNNAFAKEQAKGIEISKNLERFFALPR